VNTFNSLPSPSAWFVRLYKTLAAAGDRLFGDRLFWVKYRFSDERADYYFDLAHRMKANPGLPFTEFFAKDAQRYPDEPKGILSAVWLARYEGIDGHEQAANFSDILRGTVPDEDLAVLGVGERSSDLQQALLALSKSLTALDETRRMVIGMMAAIGITILIIQIYIGVYAFVMEPRLEASMSVYLSVDQYGPIGRAFHNMSEVIRSWGWLALMLEAALGGTVAMSMTRYTGRMRGWLDHHVLFYQVFRLFQGAQFLAGLSSVTRRWGGNESQTLMPALETMRQSAYPWLRHHIDRILLKLEYSPHVGAQIFDTGIFEKKTLHRIQDKAEYEQDISKLLEDVGDQVVATAPREIKKRAGRITAVLTVLLLLVMVVLSMSSYQVTQEMSVKARVARING
jgi:type II secretory pathway component PulF